MSHTKGHRSRQDDGPSSRRGSVAFNEYNLQPGGKMMYAPPDNIGCLHVPDRKRFFFDGYVAPKTEQAMLLLGPSVPI